MQQQAPAGVELGVELSEGFCASSGAGKARDDGIGSLERC